MAGPKIVFSVPAHEKPAVIVDQIKNLQRFVPGAQVVLHLSREFYFFKKRIEFRSEAWMRRSTIPKLRAMPDVWVNDARMSTEWGNILHTHLSNFRFAEANLDFDYFVLLSSSCLFVRSGAAELMAQHDYGLELSIPPADWEWRVKNESDPIYQAILRDCGGSDCRGGQSEGTYYRRDVFRRVADIIDRHWRFVPGHVRVHEEVYLPTIVSTLGGDNGLSPIILKMDSRKLPDFDSRTVDSIRAVRIESYADETLGDERRLRLVDHGAHFFGLRPVPRAVGDPLRSYIRSLPL